MESTRPTTTVNAVIDALADDGLAKLTYANLAVSAAAMTRTLLERADALLQEMPAGQRQLSAALVAHRLMPKAVQDGFEQVMQERGLQPDLDPTAAPPWPV